MITEKEFSENLEKIFNGENPMSFWKRSMMYLNLIKHLIA